ncbi:MAG: phytanoyl-CoA dioxygenase family protein [Burkholderiales bacterium]|nr:phytanoyl-CoA dioxygenase family protein [Burkholderiales bacterium]
MPTAAIRIGEPGRWSLDDASRARYHRDGLVIPPYRLSPDLLGEMREALDRLLANTRTMAPESLVCPHIANGARHPQAEADRWFEYATHPGILDLVQDILGPDLILWGSQVFCKPAKTGREVPWHQDGEYWPIRPLATCSAWIALDDVDPQNGCMRYIPGSHGAGSIHPHREAMREDRALGFELEPTAFDETRSADDCLEAGQFSLHDVFLIHGSLHNRSDRRRAGFVVRYMPATSRYDRGIDREQMQGGVAFSLSQRPIWLLRGQDRAGNDFQAGHGEAFAGVPRYSDDL